MLIMCLLLLLLATPNLCGIFMSLAWEIKEEHRQENLSDGEGEEEVTGPPHPGFGPGPRSNDARRIGSTSSISIRLPSSEVVCAAFVIVLFPALWIQIGVAHRLHTVQVRDSLPCLDRATVPAWDLGPASCPGIGLR